MTLSRRDLPEPKNGNTYVISHRGAHIGIPENTISAYNKAIALGCDFIEVDLRKTKDGEFVSVHNSSIDDYVVGVTGEIHDFTLGELKQFNLGERFDAVWQKEKIPTIEEILQLCKGRIGLYIDLKIKDVAGLAEIINKFGMADDTLMYVKAFSSKQISTSKAYNNICRLMPDPGEKNNIANVVKEYQPCVIASDMGIICGKEYVKIAHDNNTKVFVDEQQGVVQEWSKMLDWGIDGIQTDKPEELIRLLNRR